MSRRSRKSPENNPRSAIALPKNDNSSGDAPDGGLTCGSLNDRNDGRDGSGADVDSMAKELQKLKEQLEAVRKEAYDEGFAAGYKSAVDLLQRHRPAPAAAAEQAPSDLSTLARTSPETPMPRGVTAIIIEEILRSIAPRAATPKQLYDMAKERGTLVNQNSLPRVLRRLNERGIAEPVGDTTTWKYITKPRLVGS